MSFLLSELPSASGQENTLRSATPCSQFFGVFLPFLTVSLGPFQQEENMAFRSCRRRVARNMRDGQNPTPPLRPVRPSCGSEPGPLRSRACGLPSTAHCVMRSEGDVRDLQRDSPPGHKDQTVSSVPGPPECPGRARRSPMAHTQLANKGNCMCPYLRSEALPLPHVCDGLTFIAESFFKGCRNSDLENGSLGGSDSV